ncbi:MAG: thioredoxin-disulfide reductase [bacterium]
MELIIIGSGPAGLSAGLYGKRLGISCLIIEGKNPSLATLTGEIENIPGIPKISGFDFINNLKEQVKSFGVSIIPSDCKGIIEKDGLFEVHCDDKFYTAQSIIIATGASFKRLNVEGEERLTGKGVSYCAVCDGPFFKDKDVVVVGGGDAAIEEALFLTKFANRVSVIHRRDELRAAKLLQERAFSNERIEFIFSSVVLKIMGENRVSSVKIRNVKTSEEKNIECDGVFIFIGLSPNSSIAKGILLLSDNGYIITDEDMHTSKRGVFAAGDVCEKGLRQVITALSDGAIAAYSSFLYLKNRRYL